MAISYHAHCIEYSHETSDEIPIIANYLHLNCVEYGLQKWFNPPKSVRVKRLTYNHSVTKPVNMAHCKLWNSCIVIRHTTYLF